MSSFLSESEKLECIQMQDDLFNTYMEDIIIYKTPEMTYVGTSSNFNFIFGEQQASEQINYVTQSGSFKATIEYEANRDGNRAYFNPETSPIISNQGYIRISVSGAEAAEFLKNSEKIVFDGSNFKVASDHYRRSIFGERKYYDVFLTKIET